MIGIKKGTIILTTTHIGFKVFGLVDESSRSRGLAISMFAGYCLACRIQRAPGSANGRLVF